jgi:hypothetical protein
MGREPSFAFKIELMETEKIYWDRAYEGPLNASIDWVAGGNFDGYVYRITLRFVAEGRKVIRTKSILDQSRYDGHVASDESIGTFSDTDKATLTCFFDTFQMRGKLLGERNQFIAFDIWPANRDLDRWTECYELK